MNFLVNRISQIPISPPKVSLISTLLATLLTKAVVFNHQLFTNQLGIALGKLMNNTLNSTGNNEYTSAINKLGEMAMSNTTNLTTNCVKAESSETPNSQPEVVISDLEKEMGFSEDELFDGEYFNFNSALELTPSITAELISTAFLAVWGLTRRPTNNSFTVGGKFVWGFVNDIKFLSYYPGPNFIVVIKDYYNSSEEEIWIAMAFETVDDDARKKVILSGQMQTEAEGIFANLYQ